jgi:hypothetical protein
MLHIEAWRLPLSTVDFCREISGLGFLGFGICWDLGFGIWILGFGI